MENLTPTVTPLVVADYDNEIFSTPTDERYLARPICPATGGSYDPNGAASGTYPETGIVAVLCDDNGVADGNGNGINDHLPDPADTAGW